jgi:hypothetical protein
MNITIGYQIDQPGVFIPWDIDQKGLQDLLGEYGLKRITEGYYSISCVSLGDLHHRLGFHFEIAPDAKKIEELKKFANSVGTIERTIGPNFNLKREGKLRELDFFREAYPNLKDSYDNFQIHFEKAFGKPSFTKKRNADFPNYEWKFKDVSISHYVLDRFGSEEHLSITKGTTPVSRNRGLTLFRFLFRTIWSAHR